MKVEAEQRTQSLTDAFVHRARTVCTQEEVRALCQEVWALRHVNSAYLGQVDRILKNRRAAGELPIYY